MFLFQYILLQIGANAKGAKTNILDFSGIPQLTDFAFFIMEETRKKINNMKSRLDSVAVIVLNGCHLITDYGLTRMAATFPKIEKVK